MLATPLAALCQDHNATLWRVASPIAAEPASPSDSRNQPGHNESDQLDLRQANEFRWTYQAESRDPFAERIARLEAQVAELARQLKSGPSPATAPRVFSTAQVPTAIRYAAPAHLAPASLQRSATRVTTAASGPGEPIVIHLHIHVGNGAAPARAVLAAPRVPAPPAARAPLRATPATPMDPAVPGIPGVSATPAAPRSAAAGSWDDPPGAD